MTNMIRQFLRQEAAGGLILIFAAVVALIMANTQLQGIYQSFLDVPVSVKIASLDISKPLLLWINDGLMAVFFLVVGLEVKRELMEGSLAGRDKAVFPAIAALGGMLAPALIYLMFNGADEVTRQGWAIPAATDIAFALGVMALLGNRVPTSLKVFLLALAIIDDLGVIIIIALFYTHEVSVQALGIAAAAIALLGYMNWRGVGKTSAYLLVGLVLWVCILKSGVHATLAGVIVGFMIPLHTKDKRSPSESLEHGLHPWVAYLILPIFAFANAGVSLQGVSFSGLTSLLPLGIASALFVGKPLGIFVFSWLAVKLGIAKLPDAINFKQIFAVSVLCGIGFTMSIFIASLAFGDADIALTKYSKLGILLGSTAAAVVGYSLLRLALPTNKKLSD
ncbi:MULTISPECIES: Na+/H+ antiporter NhaA [Yersinia]|uniref:Na(+)/H(+) antiporter NhaA n=1 Tax=Yersinia massiliensis TaxID=419257 RepID=A0ABM6UWT8_9GAMM|nr:MULTISPECIES: Na+/H+ antiporter NhaA [Yersinia]HEI6965516.1 Na+/H+ antiporter NhaA [Yersinia enterocolitica]AVX39563.1 Na+/H+ antiporter NhaA [Yersinia massiliensis]QKJ10322.1 Na+/H+ antiporter NhaA [Yersinia massiliensis]CFR22689.1 pH-dependent sodium/proton antiporter [Yersinia frederiksenii]CQH15054.1 pH-dependent sodium/proton antiporter [Yersinia frederiksenii]